MHSRLTTDNSFDAWGEMIPVDTAAKLPPSAEKCRLMTLHAVCLVAIEGQPDSGTTAGER